MTSSCEAGPDWNRARNLPRRRVLREREPALSGSQHALATATVGRCPLARLSVLPPGWTAAPQSFSVDWTPPWTDCQSLAWPYGLEWQQSRPGRFDLFFSLPAGVKCFGLGERYSGLDVRGALHTLCSADNMDHDESSDSLYKSIPLLLLFDGTQCTGLYLDSPAPQKWDLDSELDGLARVELYSRRPWSLYLIGPATIPTVVQTFTKLTGRSPLPPRWALGHQQCRWSYPTQDVVREIAAEFRSRRIPCDTMVLDIDYMDEYRVFTHSPERFPEFAQMIDDLARANFRVVTIVDPGVKRDPDYDLFREGVEGNLFCTTASGDVFIDEVWPGQSAFPDFLNADTRRWWADRLRFYLDRGVAGIWNDMNEPAFFTNKRPFPDDIDEMPPDDEQPFLQQSEEGSVGHFEVRNLYGLLMSRATHEGLSAARPDERPFVLTRSATAGIQRYAAVWLGDNKSWYEHMRRSIPMLLNMGLSGVPFAGVDVGGFGWHAYPELLVRWYELGIFYPFFRNHCGMEGRAQEPFSYSPAVEGMVRRLIETRYRLLPYLCGLFWEHMKTGAPVMRPLVWHYPGDAVAAEIDDQFMFGGDILVAPVTDRNKRCRPVYLPRGKWHPFDGGAVLSGGRVHLVEMPLGGVPAFVRDGAIIPTASTMESTAGYASADIVFEVFGDRAHGSFVDDDGVSHDYRQGSYNRWRLTFDGHGFRTENEHRGYAGSDRRYFLRRGRSLQPIVLQ